ncbi:Kei1p KNAG_0C04920 [Huiozyma naganishii CBS 8797]|uniref:Uncharacterized protein n=1 Tax=Huiozyma naganishii (strain ATCC MYA-139 / BCRC 22969 / CBS 8797 / KCTC 17520 / NBRC 10181 / NCYC 3082 / Yp74L-3) TaxID=1071383 RepID=J7RJ95_HUIN7|nr:hypothetical protein KNAG_0C04920 [Kazachstania naganishii CBS 8797]CCK69593.1 hypothetical protein KNAG_0C04920 [Kazachstania naganishii CBS 8797]
MTKLSSSLPKTFFGIFPLYIGVEIVLGVTLLNKCSGAFGILALFTGHPLDLMQWASYLWSVFTLVVYAQGLYQIHKPKLLTFSQIVVVFSIDTVLTCLFTLWFTGVWFAEESNTDAAMGTAASAVARLVKRGAEIDTQGATESYEYVFTIIITMVSLVFRLYFNFLLASFVQELLRHPQYLVDQDDIEQDLKNKFFLRRWWVVSQKSSYSICRHVLV